MNKEQADKKVKVTLTDERPVTVRNGNWPVMASATRDTDHNNQELFRRYYLRVRQHDIGFGSVEDGVDAPNPHPDGRCLVYGWYESSYQGESGSQAGYRCDINDVVETIRKVGDRIKAPEYLIDECVADLPEVEEEEEAETDNITLQINISIPKGDKGRAVSLCNTLIEWEIALRGQGPGGHIPVTAETRLADAICKTRHELQEITGLITPPESV